MPRDIIDLSEAQAQLKAAFPQWQHAEIREQHHQLAFGPATLELIKRGKDWECRMRQHGQGASLGSYREISQAIKIMLEASKEVDASSRPASLPSWLERLPYPAGEVRMQRYVQRGNRGPHIHQEHVGIHIELLMRGLEEKPQELLEGQISRIKTSISAGITFESMGKQEREQLLEAASTLALQDQERGWITPEGGANEWYRVKEWKVPGGTLLECSQKGSLRDEWVYISDDGSTKGPTSESLLDAWRLGAGIELKHEAPPLEEKIGRSRRGRPEEERNLARLATLRSIAHLPWAQGIARATGGEPELKELRQQLHIAHLEWLDLDPKTAESEDQPGHAWWKDWGEQAGPGWWTIQSRSLNEHQKSWNGVQHISESDKLTDYPLNWTDQHGRTEPMWFRSEKEAWAATEAIETPELLFTSRRWQQQDEEDREARQQQARKSRRNQPGGYRAIGIIPIGKSPLIDTTKALIEIDSNSVYTLMAGGTEGSLQKAAHEVLQAIRKGKLTLESQPGQHLKLSNEAKELFIIPRQREKHQGWAGQADQAVAAMIEADLAQEDVAEARTLLLREHGKPAPKVRPEQQERFDQVLERTGQLPHARAHALLGLLDADGERRHAKLRELEATIDRQLLEAQATGVPFDPRSEVDAEGRLLPHRHRLRFRERFPSQDSKAWEKLESELRSAWEEHDIHPIEVALSRCRIDREMAATVMVADQLIIPLIGDLPDRRPIQGISDIERGLLHVSRMRHWGTMAPRSGPRCSGRYTIAAVLGEQQIMLEPGAAQGTAGWYRTAREAWLMAPQRVEHIAGYRGQTGRFDQNGDRLRMICLQDQKGELIEQERDRPKLLPRWTLGQAPKINPQQISRNLPREMCEMPLEAQLASVLELRKDERQLPQMAVWLVQLAWLREQKGGATPFFPWVEGCQPEVSKTRLSEWMAAGRELEKLEYQLPEKATINSLAAAWRQRSDTSRVTQREKSSDETAEESTGEQASPKKTYEWIEHPSPTWFMGGMIKRRAGSLRRWRAEELRHHLGYLPGGIEERRQKLWLGDQTILDRLLDTEAQDQPDPWENMESTTMSRLSLLLHRSDQAHLREKTREMFRLENEQDNEPVPNMLIHMERASKYRRKPGWAALLGKQSEPREISPATGFRLLKSEENLDPWRSQCYAALLEEALPDLEEACELSGFDPVSMQQLLAGERPWDELDSEAIVGLGRAVYAGREKPGLQLRKRLLLKGDEGERDVHEAQLAEVNAICGPTAPMTKSNAEQNQPEERRIPDPRWGPSRVAGKMLHRSGEQMGSWRAQELEYQLRYLDMKQEALSLWSGTPGTLEKLIEKGHPDIEERWQQLSHSDLLALAKLLYGPETEDPRETMKLLHFDEIDRLKLESNPREAIDTLKAGGDITPWQRKLLKMVLDSKGKEAQRELRHTEVSQEELDELLNPRGAKWESKSERIAAGLGKLIRGRHIARPAKYARSFLLLPGDGGTRDKIDAEIGITHRTPREDIDPWKIPEKQEPMASNRQLDEWRSCRLEARIKHLQLDAAAAAERCGIETELMTQLLAGKRWEEVDAAILCALARLLRKKQKPDDHATMAEYLAFSGLAEPEEQHHFRRMPPRKAPHRKGKENEPARPESGDLDPWRARWFGWWLREKRITIRQLSEDSGVGTGRVGALAGSGGKKPAATWSGVDRETIKLLLNTISKTEAISWPQLAERLAIDPKGVRPDKLVGSSRNRRKEGMAITKRLRGKPAIPRDTKAPRLNSFSEVDHWRAATFRWHLDRLGIRPYVIAEAAGLSNSSIAALAMANPRENQRLVRRWSRVTPAELSAIASTMNLVHRTTEASLRKLLQLEVDN